MTRILILGGTREAVELAQRLHERDALEIVSSLAGRTHAPHMPPGKVRVGGFGGAAGLRDYLVREKIDLLIDATHPFAERMHGNAAEASRGAGVPLLRLERPAWQPQSGDRWIMVESADDSAQLASTHGKRAFLTTGVKDLGAFRDIEDVWFLVRLVEAPPEPMPIRHCELIRGRGPFAAPDEEALMRRYNIDLLISKESGGDSTYGKIEAARKLGIPVIMIRRPAAKAGAEIVTSIDAVISWIDEILSERKSSTLVIPAKAGTQRLQSARHLPGPFRGDDRKGDKY
jgi:precorrin-6A/cobalt-precorrin-6A reductase